MYIKYLNSQKGVVFIPVLIFILSTVVVGGAAGFVKVAQIEKQIQQTDARVASDLAQLYKINQAQRALNEKAETYSRLGVEVEKVSTASAELAKLIRQKNFAKSQFLLSELDKELEKKLTQKREAERQATVQLRNKLEAKLVEFKKKGVNVTEVDTKLPEVRGLIDSQEFTQAREEIEKLSLRLDQLLAIKVEEERKAAAAAQTQQVNQNVAGVSYSRKQVTTPRGNFTVDVLTVNLNQVRVVTDTANSNDCDNNCPTKPLASYVAESGGIAGIHGTYFCPPDYSQCAGKVASYDFPVYNTKLGKFINADTLFWSGRAMVAIDTAGNPHFFREANSFGGINLHAAIVNYPALLSGGQIVVNVGSLPASLGQVKGTRGAIGFSGKTLFAVVGRSATVSDMAYVMQALGAQYAMNLDGGGSAALYFAGSYKVGPGRNLPNAIIFAK